MASKDFDGWNKLKKELGSRKLRFYRQREVWWCSIGVNVGFEQDGTGEKYDRPVLILKCINRNISIILPITTSNEKSIERISIGDIDGKESFVLIPQIRLIDTRRLTNKIKSLDQKLFETIRKAARDLL